MQCYLTATLGSMAEGWAPDNLLWHDLGTRHYCTLLYLSRLSRHSGVRQCKRMSITAAISRCVLVSGPPGSATTS